MPSETSSQAGGAGWNLTKCQVRRGVHKQEEGGLATRGKTVPSAEGARW